MPAFKNLRALAGRASSPCAECQVRRGDDFSSVATIEDGNGADQIASRRIQDIQSASVRTSGSPFQRVCACMEEFGVEQFHHGTIQWPCRYPLWATVRPLGIFVRFADRFRNKLPLTPAAAPLASPRCVHKIARAALRRMQDGDARRFVNGVHSSSVRSSATRRSESKQCRRYPAPGTDSP